LQVDGVGDGTREVLCYRRVDAEITFGEIRDFVKQLQDGSLVTIVL